MANRIATSFQYTLFRSQLQRTQGDLLRTQNKITTGLEVAKPSDDPSSSATIAQFQTAVERLDRHEDRITSAVSLLEYQEGIVSEANNIMIRAEEIARQTANGAVSAENRLALSEEVFELRGALVALGNSSYNGQYIYGGADTDDTPFDAQTAPAPAGYAVPGTNATDPENIRYSYDFLSSGEAGSDLTRTVPIGDRESVRINTQGDVVFQQAISGLEMLGRALSGYTSTAANATASDGSSISATTGAGAALNLPTDYDLQTQEILSSIEMIERSQQQDLLPELNSLGARMNRLAQSQSAIEVLKLSSEQARAKLQDADIFEAASDLSALNNSLEALLAVQARVGNVSLLNFI